MLSHGQKNNAPSLFLAMLALLFSAPSRGAEQLALRPGISFSQDIDNGFPIIADKFDDIKPEPGRPTLIFFGASGDLNCNRQAKRIVDLYKKNRQSPLKFVLIDVDQANTNQSRQLVKSFYRGYIPCEVLLDRSGNKAWSQIGEIDNRILQDQIDKLLPD